MADHRDTDLIASLQAQIAELTKAVTTQATAISKLASSDESRPASPSITIATLFAEYERIRKHEKSWGAIRSRLLPLVKRFGDRRVADLTPMLWAEHRASRASETTYRGAPPCDATLNMELARTKEMINVGISVGLLEKNPLEAAKRVKTASARETWLTEDQIQRLLTGTEAISKPRARLLMRAFILCGVDAMLRFNEVRRLRRDKINAFGDIESLGARQTKSKKQRFVALLPRDLEAIEEVPPVLGTPYIFANPDTGRLYSATILRQWFRTACVASGVDAFAAEGERVVPHTLRHSGASLADARGASAMAIKDALGHSFLSTTERYLHRHKRTGARALAKLMANGATEELQKPAGGERRGPHRAGDPATKSGEEKNKAEASK